MRGTTAGFAIVVKAAEAASSEIDRQPGLKPIVLILEGWGFDPLRAPASVIRLAESYRRLVVGWPK